MNLKVMNPISSQFLAVLFLLIGLLIRYLIGRRRFNRRGIGGLQHYSNYERAVGTIFLEWLFKWLAYGLIAAGVFLLIRW